MTGLRRGRQLGAVGGQLGREGRGLLARDAAEHHEVRHGVAAQAVRTVTGVQTCALPIL